MKMSQLYAAAGLPSNTSERDALATIRRQREPANSKEAPGTPPEGGQQFSIYAAGAALLADDPTKQRKIEVRAIRQGFWLAYVLDGNRMVQLTGPETSDLQGLEQFLFKKFGRTPSTAAVKSDRARQKQVDDAVNEVMQKQGKSYTESFSQVRRTHSHLFANMVDPAPAQAAAARPKARR